MKQYNYWKDIDRAQHYGGIDFTRPYSEQSNMQYLTTETTKEAQRIVLDKYIADYEIREEEPPF